MVAGRNLAGERCRDWLLPVDRHVRVGRIRLDAQLARARDALQRELQIGIAIRLDDDGAVGGEISGAAQLNRVLAQAQLAAPRSEPHVFAVDRHCRSDGSRRDGQTGSSRGRRHLLLERQVLVARHRELDREIAPPWRTEHHFVPTSRDRREERGASALFAVDDDHRPDRIGLDGQRGIFRHRRQHERELHVAPRPADDLPLLAKPSGRLHCDDVRAGCELCGVRSNADRGAVDQDARLLGFGGDRQ